jgi:5-methylcytosine-specific restriction endonuclease McrA
MARSSQRPNSWIPRKVREAVLSAEFCANCGRDNDGSIPFHVDHVQPHSLDGSNEIHNLRALCAPCNLKRGNRVSGDRVTWFNDRYFSSKKFPTTTETDS